MLTKVAEQRLHSKESSTFCSGLSMLELVSSGSPKLERLDSKLVDNILVDIGGSMDNDSGKAVQLGVVEFLDWTATAKGVGVMEPNFFRWFIVVFGKLPTISIKRIKTLYSGSDY